jgi:rhodanese-related sulfurtransferase
MTPISFLSAKEAAKHLNKALFLDVRTSAEYQSAHIKSSVLQPLATLEAAHIKNLLKNKSPCIIVCRSGNRAQHAFAKLQAEGNEPLYVLEGGLMAWQALNLPVIEGKSVMALDRQVRIAAGSLTLLGLALAYFIHPAFALISACIGAGLVYSGVTDSCGMGCILSKMPWNKAPSCCHKKD